MSDRFWPEVAGQNFQNLRFERPVSEKAAVQHEWQVCGPRKLRFWARHFGGDPTSPTAGNSSPGIK